jgi:hypothetical protein
LRTSGRLRASAGTSRGARSWKEEQVSAAGAKIPRITRRLEGSTLHLDDKLWPEKEQSEKSSNEIKITVKPSPLIILQPAAAVKI